MTAGALPLLHGGHGGGGWRGKVLPFRCRIGAAAVGSLGCALTRLVQDEREQPRVLLGRLHSRPRGVARLSAHHKVDEPDDYPNCLEKGGPDHEAYHKLHGKPERPRTKSRS